MLEDKRWVLFMISNWCMPCSNRCQNDMEKGMVGIQGFCELCLGEGIMRRWELLSWFRVGGRVGEGWEGMEEGYDGWMDGGRKECC